MNNINILLAGDFCPQYRILEFINNNDYSFFDEIKQIIAESDYSIVNLEAPVITSIETPPIDKTGPHLHCSKYAISSLKYANFSCVSLANNHFYDYGEIGVTNTIDSCEKLGIDYVGGGRNIFQAKRYISKQIKGKIITILSFCESEWSIATENSGGSNPLDPIDNYYQIQEARTNSDFVIVVTHGGKEGYQLPTPRMKSTYRFLIDSGADVVVNHHQHCYSGYEVYNNKHIFYGIGNFCFDDITKRNTTWNEGYMVMLSFNGNDIKFDLIPYTQCNQKPIIEIVEDKSKFESNILYLNSIISDDIKLNNKFKDFVRNIEENYLLLMEPYPKLFKSLRTRKLFPSFLTNSWKLIMCNIIRCETHNEILLNILSKRK